MTSETWTARCDIAVVGAGIVGLATARELSARYPRRSVVVLEKEAAPARHQTGHNSGVIHSGVYYVPGSAKARLCTRGRRMLIDYCTERRIPFEITGKLVVASDAAESSSLERLLERGRTNGLDGLRVLDEREIRDVEPAVRGRRGLWVPQAGIVNYARVAETLTDDLRSRGVGVRFGAAVRGLSVGSDGVAIKTELGTLAADRLVVCAGLQSDQLARIAGAPSAPRIIPFRGDYYVLRRERRSLVRGLVYPVPDPRFPFLGVHFTRRIDGEVLLGPNAVFAFAREGYRRTDVSVSELVGALAYEGFRRLAARHWRTGLGEIARDFYKPLFVDALRRYIPEVGARDLLPGPSGVRAQAVDHTGALVDDFVFDAVGPVLNVRNAPSPAATSAFALACEIADRLEGPGVD